MNIYNKNSPAGGKKPGKMSTNQEIGNRIRGLRKTMELTQVEFAEKIGITQGTLTDIERGRIGCTVSNLLKISEITAASVNYILGLEPYPYEQTLKSGLTTMGVGDGGGNLFVQGSYDAIKVVQGWYDELQYLRKLNMDRFKKPVNINLGDFPNDGVAMIFGPDVTVESIRETIIKAAKATIRQL